MRDLLDQISASMTANGLVPSDGRILVAVSGGMDSQLLLHVLHQLACPMSLTLTVVHANHQLRGTAAEADAKLVEESAATLGWRFVGERLPVAQVHAGSGESLEMTARRLRHECLARVARHLGISTVALAHHADDQAELVLLRLLRGSGGDGLGGMARQNASPADDRVRLVRPFLDLPRSSLISAARRAGIRFREDRTNRDTQFLRNRIRHDLIPLLEKRFTPAVRTLLARSAELVGADSEYVTLAAHRWVAAKRRAHFDSLPTALQRGVLREQIRTIGFEPGFELIERLRLGSGMPEEIQLGLRIRRAGDGEIVRVPPGRSEPFRTDASVHRLLPGGGILRTGDRQVEYRTRLLKAPLQARSVRNGESFSARAVGTEVVLRHWRPGDRFQPLGFRSESKLKEILINRKVPADLRRRLLVATTAKGTLFWVESLPPGERFKVRGSTRRVLVWKWHPET